MGPRRPRGSGPRGRPPAPRARPAPREPAPGLPRAPRTALRRRAPDGPRRRHSLLFFLVWAPVPRFLGLLCLEKFLVAAAGPLRLVGYPSPRRSWGVAGPASRSAPPGRSPSCQNAGASWSPGPAGGRRAAAGAGLLLSAGRGFNFPRLPTPASPGLRGFTGASGSLRAAPLPRLARTARPEPLKLRVVAARGPRAPSFWKRPSQPPAERGEHVGAAPDGWKPRPNSPRGAASEL